LGQIKSELALRMIPDNAGNSTFLVEYHETDLPGTSVFFGEWNWIKRDRQVQVENLGRPGQKIPNRSANQPNPLILGIREERQDIPQEFLTTLRDVEGAMSVFP
jgi:hypothetical protein